MKYLFSRTITKFQIFKIVYNYIWNPGRSKFPVLPFPPPCTPVYAHSDLMTPSLEFPGNGLADGALGPRRIPSRIAVGFLQFRVQCSVQ